MTTTPTFSPALPPRPGRYVPTNIVKGVRVVIQASVATGDMCLIDGPVGIGKTTAIVEAARAIGRKVVYVNMVGTISTRDEMDAIWVALTGISGVGSASQIRDDILAALQREDIVLIIDDAHHVRKQGMLTLLNIWNRIHARRGTGTPIVWCGNNLSAKLDATVREVFSRAGLEYKAAPLAGKPLADTVLAMEPLIAGTNPDVIRNINVRHFNGELRRWNQFLGLILLFRAEDKEPRPLTDEEAGQVLGLMPSRPKK
jgi:hypothetical protein